MSETVWFVADLHFGHENILKYCSKTRGLIYFPKKTHINNIHDHDEFLIQAWNKRVVKKDRVYILGDFGLASTEYLVSILKRLHGIKYLIKGNHDRISRSMREKFVWVRDYHELKIKDDEIGDKQKIILFHYPIESWNGKTRGAWHLHGHIHSDGSYREGMEARVDVGLEMCLRDPMELLPVSYEEVKRTITIRTLTKGL